MSNSKNKITSSGSFNNCFDELTKLNEAAVRTTSIPVLYVDLSPSNTDDEALSLIRAYTSEFNSKYPRNEIKYFTNYIYDDPQKALESSEPANYSEVLIDMISNGYTNVYVLTDSDIKDYANAMAYNMMKSANVNIVYVDDLDKNRKLAKWQSQPKERIRYIL